MMMRYTLFGAIASLAIAGCLIGAAQLQAAELVNSQAPAPDCAAPGSLIWKRQSGTSGRDTARIAGIDASNNIFVISLWRDGVVTKYSPSGQRLATRNTSGYRWDAATMDGQGNLVSVSRGDPGVSKYSATGTTVWTRPLGDFRPSSVTTDADDDIIVIGADGENNACCPADIFINKYSSEGDLLWSALVKRSLDHFHEYMTAYSVAADAEGSIVIAGEAYTDGSPTLPFQLVFLVKFSGDGQLLWERHFGAGRFNWAGAATVDTAGNILVTGATDGPFGGSYRGGTDVFTAKFDSAGRLLWKRQIGTPADDRAGWIATDGAGNSVIAGSTEGMLGGFYHGETDVFAARYSPAGKLLWKRQFGTASSEDVDSVAVGSDGNPVINGQTTGAFGGPHRGEEDVFILKLHR